MNIKLHFDGHGLNDESGQRVYTLQRNHANDGGGYVLDSDKASELSDFIVRACNSHYELVEALTEVAEYAAAEIGLQVSDCVAGPIGKARAALAKAKGEE